MFFPGSDSSQDTRGVVLIPTRFVWPYGGRRVFVSGTFTRFVFGLCFIRNLVVVKFVDILLLFLTGIYSLEIRNTV